MAVKPNPYSQNEWLRLPAAKRGFKTYKDYTSWWQKTVRPKYPQTTTTRTRTQTTRLPSLNLPGPPEPYQVPSYLNPIDPSNLLSQARSSIESQIYPLMDYYMKGLDARGRAQSARLKEATDEFVADTSNMAPAVGAAYDESIRGVQNVNQGIRTFLGGEGQEAAAETRAALEATGAPEASIQANAGSVESLGRGIEGQALGRGSLEESMLYGNRAADVTAAQEYPKFASEYGVKAAYDLESALIGEQRGITEQFQSQIPGLVQTTYQTLVDREIEKAMARADLEQSSRSERSSYDQWVESIRQSERDYGLQRSIAQANQLGGGNAQEAFSLFNTPQGTVRYNQVTGQVEPIAGTAPSPKTVKPKAINTAAIQDSAKGAIDLHSQMLKTFAEINNPANPAYASLTKAQKKQRHNQILNQTREKARESVYGALAARFPKQSKEWHHKTAANLLRQAGWIQAAETIESRMGGGGVVTAPARTTPARPAARPAARPVARPATRPATRPSSTVRQSPDTMEAGTKARERAKGRMETKKMNQQKESQAYDSALSTALGGKQGKVPRGKTRAEVIKVLQRTLPGWKHTRIIALADRAMKNSYGSFYTGG